MGNRVCCTSGTPTQGVLPTGGSHKAKVQTVGERCGQLGQAREILEENLQGRNERELKKHRSRLPGPFFLRCVSFSSREKSEDKISAARPHGNCSLSEGRARRGFYKTLAGEEENRICMGVQRIIHVPANSKYTFSFPLASVCLQSSPPPTSRVSPHSGPI